MIRIRTKGIKFHFDNLYLDEPKQYGAILIYQIGDLCCSSEHVVQPHIQTCHEISYILSGIGTFYKDQKPYRVKSGDIFLSAVNSGHQIVSSSYDPLRYFYCGFKIDTTHPDHMRFKGLENLMQNYDNPLIKDKYNIHNIFSNICNEIILNYPNKDRIIENYLDLLFLLTERNYTQKGVLNETILQDDRFKNRLVYDIINFIDNNITNIQSMTDISNNIGYSYSHISQVFSSTMGVSLSSYYQKIRFEKAIELMKIKISITQVAEMLGFDSIHSFSRSFKKFYGISPTSYLESQFDKHGDDLPD